MRDTRPFDLTVLPGSFLDITAKLIIHDNPSREIPFNFMVDRFMPLPAHLKWQTIKELEVLIEMKYEVKVVKGVSVIEGEGKYIVSAKWSVDYNDDGINLQTIKVTPLVQKGEGKFAIHIDANLYQQSLKGDIANTLLDLILTGGYTDDGVSVGFGPFQANVGGSTGTYVKTYEFQIAQFATHRPAPPIQLPEHLLSHDVFFEKEDQAQVGVEELRRLEDRWSDPLRKEAPELAAAIEAGNCPLTLTGHASVTGRSKEYNRSLSERRITSVADAIKTTFKSKKIAYVPVPKGQIMATQRGPAAQERRVEILINRDKAKAFFPKAKRQ